VGTQPAVQFLEQRHDRIKLFSENLICYRLCACIDLAGGFSSVFRGGKLCSFLVTAFSQRGNSSFQGFHPIDCIGSFEHRKSSL
jgi:hypothetical protein